MSYLSECRSRWTTPLSFDRLYDFTAQTFGAHPELRDGPPVFEAPSSWALDVARLGRAAAERFGAGDAYRPPGLSIEDDPAIRLRDPRDLDGLEDVAGAIIERVEHTLFGCHVAVDKLHVYRQLPSERAPAAGGSWTWHVDGHPSEIVKALVYLTDVDDTCSAFQLVWSDAKRRALRGESRPLDRRTWQPGSPREGFEVPAGAIERRAEYRPQRVIGPAGTVAIFANNCVHRATLGRERFRDTLVLRLRPVLERPAVMFAPSVRLEDGGAKLPHAAVADQLVALANEGYLHLRGVVPPERALAVAASFPAVGGAEIDGGFVDLDDDRVRDLASLVEARLGAAIGPMVTARLLRKPPRSAGAAWHQDCAYWTTGPRVTIWIALADMDETSGCLRVVPRSHGSVRTHTARSGAFGLTTTVDEHETLAAIPVRAGDVVILDERIVHGSFDNAGGHARAAVALTATRPAGSS